MHNTIIALITIWCMLIAMCDIQYKKIPNNILIVMLLPAILALIFNGKGLLGIAVRPSLIGMAIAFLFFLPGYVFNKLGAGDVKFAAVVGLLLGGWAAVDMLVMSCLFMGVLALLWKRFFPVGSLRFPAGVALALAAIIELFFGALVVESKLLQ